MQWAGKKSGFTIVELLIVIVVIAILASITVVGFAGIRARADDSAVQADLRSFVNNARVKLQTSQISQYPVGSDGPLNAISYKFNRSSYDEASGSVLYCVNTAGTLMVAHGRSASGTQFYYTSEGATGTTTTAFNSYGALCSPFTGSTSAVYARYGKSSGVWNSWTQ